MNTDELLEHFRQRGTPEHILRATVAEALGLSRQAVHLWGPIVPARAAVIAYHRLDGAVPLRPEHYDPNEAVA